MAMCSIGPSVRLSLTLQPALELGAVRAVAGVHAVGQERSDEGEEDDEECW